MKSLQQRDGRRPHARAFSFGAALCGMYLAASAAHAKAEDHTRPRSDTSCSSVRVP